MQNRYQLMTRLERRGDEVVMTCDDGSESWVLPSGAKESLERTLSQEGVSLPLSLRDDVGFLSREATRAYHGPCAVEEIEGRLSMPNSWGMRVCL